MFIYYHANPSGKTTGDCVLRAISLLENISWRQALLELTAYSYFLYELADDNEDLLKLRHEFDDFIK